MNMEMEMKSEMREMMLKVGGYGFIGLWAFTGNPAILGLIP